MRLLLFILAWLGLAPSIFAKSDISWVEILNKEESIRTHNNPNLPKLSQHLNLIPFEQIELHFKQSKPSQKWKRNFWMVFSFNPTTEKGDWLLSYLQRHPQQIEPLSLYALQRVISQKHTSTLITLLQKDFKNNPSMLSILKSLPGPETFQFFLERYLDQSEPNQFSDLITTTNIKCAPLLIRLIERGNSKEKKCGRTAAARLWGLSEQNVDDETLIIKLKASLNQKQNESIDINPSSDQLVQLYRDLRQALPAKRESLIQQILDNPSFSGETNLQSSQFINMNNPLIQNTFRARSLDLNFEALKKYSAYVNSLSSHDGQVRSKALLTLKEQKDIDLYPLFLNFISDPHSQTKEHALDAINTLMETDEDLYEMIQVDISLHKKLIQLLNHTDLDIQIATLMVLAKVNAPSTYSKIFSKMDSKHRSIRNAVLDLITEAELRSATEVIEKGLKDSDWSIRARTIRIYQEIGIESKDEVSLIIKAFQQEKDTFVKAEMQKVFDDLPSKFKSMAP